MAIFERTCIFQPIILGIQVSFFPGVHPVGPIQHHSRCWFGQPTIGRAAESTTWPGLKNIDLKRTGRVILARCPLGIWSKPNKSTSCVYVLDIPVFASHNQACDSVKDQDCFVSTGCNRLLLKGILERTISYVLNPIFPLNAWWGQTTWTKSIIGFVFILETSLGQATKTLYFQSFSEQIMILLLIQVMF